MFSTLTYIYLEFVFVLATIAILLIQPKFLKYRHGVMVVFLFYIIFIANRVGLRPLQIHFNLPDVELFIKACLLPSIGLGLIIVLIQQYNPKLLVDTTKIINLPNFPKFAPLVFYPLLSVPLQEIIFRWFYTGRLENSGLSAVLMVIVSSLIFGLAHLPFGSMAMMVGTFILGLWWNGLYLQTGNLWYPIISHAILGNILIWLALYPHENKIVS